MLAVAPLGRAQYTIVIDGKTTTREKVIEGQITRDTLLEHRDRHAAKYIAVVGPGFAGGDLIERARKHRVLLVPTDALIELLKIQERGSLSLEELEEPFSQIGVLNLDSCAKLAQVMANYAREVELLSKLIPKMLEIQRTEESTNIDVLRWALDKRFSTEEIRRALAFLGQAKAVSSSRNGNYIATMGPAALALKLRNIADAVQGR